MTYRFLQPLYFDRVYSTPIIGVLTNGQAFLFHTILPILLSFIFFKIDYFSNPIWIMLDRPKEVLTLVRFTRKFMGKSNSNSNISLISTPTSVDFAYLTLNQ